MKKIAIVFVVIGLIAIGAYFFMRHSISTPGFTPAQAKEPEAKTKPPETVLDLRPQFVKKLQQLVKQGSDGLYNLSVHEVNPDVLNSNLGISHVLLWPDTAALKELNAQGKLPDAIFRIKADSIWMDGLGVKDILSKDVADVKTIHIFHPTIDVYSKKRAYNKTKPAKTLYQRLMSEMKHIGIGKVSIEKATLVVHDLESNKNHTYNGVAVDLSNILIDSTTQFDKTRFLFAKEAELSLKNYTIPSSNSLYNFKVGFVSIAATKHLFVARNILLQPKYSKEEFQKHTKTMQERYVIRVPSIEFRNIDWWGFLNNNTLQADLAAIGKVNFDIYLDRRLPSGAPRVNNFPSQLLMKLPLKINISKVSIADLNVRYQEFSPQSGKSGTLYIDKMHGTISNLTNMPGVIKKNKFTTLSARGVFMHVAPADLTIRFDMSQYKTGVFSAGLKFLKGFDGTMINSIAEPLGLFRVKHGQLRQLTSQMSGNNYTASGHVLFLYNDLHVTPLKKDSTKADGFRKKSVTSFIANSFVLKDQNPSKNGEVRRAFASTKRKPGTSFFNLLWKVSFVGILKTIGAPERLAGE